MATAGHECESSPWGARTLGRWDAVAVADAAPREHLPRGWVLWVGVTPRTGVGRDGAGCGCECGNGNGMSATTTTTVVEAVKVEAEVVCVLDASARLSTLGAFVVCCWFVGLLCLLLLLPLMLLLLLALLKIDKTNCWCRAVLLMSPEPENVLFVFRVTLRFILSFAPRFLLTLVGLLYPRQPTNRTQIFSPRANRCPLPVRRTLVLIYVQFGFKSCQLNTSLATGPRWQQKSHAIFVSSPSTVEI